MATGIQRFYRMILLDDVANQERNLFLIPYRHRRGSLRHLHFHAHTQARLHLTADPLNARVSFPTSSQFNPQFSMRAGRDAAHAAQALRMVVPLSRVCSLHRRPGFPSLYVSLRLQRKQSYRWGESPNLDSSRALRCLPGSKDRYRPRRSAAEKGYGISSARRT